MSKKNPHLQDGVSTHADLLLHHLGDTRIVCHLDDTELYHMLNDRGFDVLFSVHPLSERYPFDTILNACRIGNYLFCKKSTVDVVILTYCNENNIKILDVPQGYTKCSMAVVDEKSIITADVPIANIAKQNGFDVLLINQTDIEIDQYNHGFIGGCCGKIAKNKIYFTGCLDGIREGKKIKSFIKSKKIEVIEGTYKTLLDVGGVLPLIY